jgi:uncharacterized repeat protein (TIGR04076 family)
MRDLEVKIAEIKGNCPVYRKGDSFIIIEGYKLKAEKPVCMHSLASIMPYYVALSRGISPGELGLAKENKNIAYVQCLDPCECTGGGTVVFAIKKLI